MIHRNRSILVAAIFAGCAIAMPRPTCAQYNPLLPAGVGSGTEYYGGYYGGGSGIGRGKGPVPEGGDANPADTLLRQIEGTNYGHYTGHSYIRGQSQRKPTQAGKAATVRYDRRGDYERDLYLRTPTSRRPASRSATRSASATKRLPNPARYY